MDLSKPSKSFFVINWKADLTAALVVFFVALPLNLGIAMASGAPLTSGILSGIAGALVVALISGSAVSVSGPAAGLTLIVFSAIQQLPSFEAFLTAVVLAGLVQIILGLLRTGIFALFFPTAVIKGMLASIGLIIILKQIPHLMGIDAGAFGEMEFFQLDGRNTITEIAFAAEHVEPGPLMLGLLSLVLMILWQNPFVESKLGALGRIPAPILVVSMGIGATLLFSDAEAGWNIASTHRVNLPVKANPIEWLQALHFPDFSALSIPATYTIALTLALVGSIESLLSVEAIDQLDPKNRRTPKNQELIAQGAGNIASGLIGGIPISAVIVRSSVNLNAGAQTRWSGFIHGILLLVSTLFIARWLNLIPLSVLAAVLILTGYRLSQPKLYKRHFRLGSNQFWPFVVTIVAILFTDLPIGIGIGLIVSFYFILKANFTVPLTMHKLDSTVPGAEETIEIQLPEVVSFLNKASISSSLYKLPKNTHVILNGKGVQHIDFDVLEAIRQYQRTAKQRNIRLEVVDLIGWEAE